MRCYIVHVYSERRYLNVALLGRAFATKAGAEAWIAANPALSGQRYEIECLPVYDD